MILACGGSNPSTPAIKVYFMQTNVLLLASKSLSRKNLLEKSHIPFLLIKQKINEDNIDFDLSLEENVKNIAISKINQVDINYENFNHKLLNKEIKFILAADTLGQDSNNTILGKPKDYNDAVSKLITLKNKVNFCATAFVLDKRVYDLSTNSWITKDRVIKVVRSEYIFIIPDYYIDYYLKNSNALSASGAISIENLGMQFLKCVNGSYSSILGLPLFELREELERLNFFTC